MKGIYVSRATDQESFNKYYTDLIQESNQHLIDEYNKQAKLGFVGVHQQIVYLIALRKVMNTRFGKSPIRIENEVVVSMSGQIYVMGNTYHHSQLLASLYQLFRKII
jgi:hypothetical protein